MFGPFYAHKIAEQARKAKKLETLEVTAEELLEAFIASGLSKEKAQIQVNVQEAFGQNVEVVIGGKKYKLKSK